MASKFRMPTLKRATSRSGAFPLRKWLPADVRLEYQALYGGPAWEVKATIPAGTSPEKAKALHAAFHGLVDGRRSGPARVARALISHRVRPMPRREIGTDGSFLIEM